MPKRPPKITQEDLDAFHKAVEGTVPLARKKARIAPVHAPKRSPRRRAAVDTEEPFHLSDALHLDIVSGEDFISYKRDGISNKILRKLRKGQYNVEAKLDLHGMSIEEARTAINHFLQHCLHERMRVVLIVHGKGSHSEAPILKNKLNHWLRELNVVLAFCSAAPFHGSRGAIYVLLKNTTEEKFA